MYLISHEMLSYWEFTLVRIYKKKEKQKFKMYHVLVAFYLEKRQDYYKQILRAHKGPTQEHHVEQTFLSTFVEHQVCYTMVKLKHLTWIYKQLAGSEDIKKRKMNQ